MAGTKLNKFALVAESVDASDLKSDWAHPQCQFKSGSGHHLKDSHPRVFFVTQTAEVYILHVHKKDITITVWIIYLK